MKIAFIHDDRKISTGAHYINDLISSKMTERGVKVKNFYPRAPLFDAPRHLKGLRNILFFYSLLENKDEILKCDLIQGTTYTPLTFLPFKIPVVSHFGSTTYGFLKNVPLASSMEKELRSYIIDLKKQKVIPEVNTPNRRALRDITEVEIMVAKEANGVIATSEGVKNELVENKVPVEKIEVIHNAIEDFWFEKSFVFKTGTQRKIIYLARLSDDVFTFKLKGLDRAMDIFSKFSDTEKIVIIITKNVKLSEYLLKKFPNLKLYVNISKEQIYNLFQELSGSVLFLPSRYEGFSLSLVEAMSQGIIPVAYPVGVAPEIITDNKNGFLARNQKEAKVYIENILKMDEEKCKSLSTSAYATSLNFRADIMVDKMISFYKKLLNK